MLPLPIALALFLLAPGPSAPPAAEVLAFEGATVLTLEPGAAPLRDTTVLVEDGRIVALRPTQGFEPPAGAQRIDARGRFLLPGFTDMHCHLLSDDKIADGYVGEELAVIVANGVTTFRDPIGKPELLATRARVAKGELLGPTLWVASPQLCGRAYGPVFLGVEVRDAASARDAVRRFRAEGYDFIKLTTDISRPVFDAVVETARDVGIRVIGHVGPDVGLERALAAGMQIEHLDQYIERLLPDDSPRRQSLSDQGIYRNWDTLELLDERRIPALVQSVARAGVWSTPTSAFWHTAFGRGWSDADVDASPDARFVSLAVRAELLIGRDQFETRVHPPREKRERFVHLRNEIVRQLYDAGGKLLAGSDCPEWVLLYGFSLHRELEQLVLAGLPPRAALEAATRNPAEWLGVLADAGTVAVGKRADLLLLAQDPLEDIRNTRTIEGVMLRGRWLPKEELGALLDHAAQTLSHAPLRPEYGG